MPIRIDEHKELQKTEVAWLSSGDWELPSQIEAFRLWLLRDGKELPRSSYTADLGFCPRPGALGGGEVICSEMMSAMLEIGMELFLSEYPPQDEEDPSRC